MGTLPVWKYGLDLVAIGLGSTSELLARMLTVNDFPLPENGFCFEPYEIKKIAALIGKRISLDACEDIYPGIRMSLKANPR